MAQSPSIADRAEAGYADSAGSESETRIANRGTIPGLKVEGDAAGREEVEVGFDRCDQAGIGSYHYGAQVDDGYVGPIATKAEVGYWGVRDVGKRAVGPADQVRPSDTLLRLSAGSVPAQHTAPVGSRGLRSRLVLRGQRGVAGENTKRRGAAAGLWRNSLVARLDTANDTGCTRSARTDKAQARHRQMGAVFGRLLFGQDEAPGWTARSTVDAGRASKSSVDWEEDLTKDYEQLTESALMMVVLEWYRLQALRGVQSSLV
jgi:hypothetical protein